MLLMDTKIGETLNRTKLLFDAVAWFESISTDLKSKIINEWIQDDQLLKKGVDSDNNVIGFYSLTTSLINPTKTFNSHYTLKDTGAFYRSMFVRVLKDSIIIDGDPGKMDDQIWYNEDKILNLNEENLAKFIAEIKINYIKYVRKILAIN